jgi:alpha-1,3-rhamnosyl/mannosyltransferase
MINKKITILIDVDPMASPTKSGIGYYTEQLVKDLSAIDPPNIRIVGHYFNPLGKNSPNLYTSSNIKYISSKIFPRQLLNFFRRRNIPFPYELLTRVKPDFIIYTNFLSRYTFFKTPYAPIVHDFTYLDYPEHMSEKNQADLKRLMPGTLGGASFAITISQTSKKYLKKHYPRFNRPVIAELIDLEGSNVSQKSNINLRKLGINKDYILFIGNIEPRKNLRGALEAYYLLPVKLRNKYSLVVAGGNSWGPDLDMDFPGIKKEKNIIFLGYVNEEVKAALYTHASLFIFPSFYEGLGMPIIESMQYRIPAAISNIEVHKEVAKDAAIYFDPYNAKDMANKIEYILSNPKLQKEILNNSKKVLHSLKSHNPAALIVIQIVKTISQ